jgi:menaquinone-dependent protoporphyrinogen oxidase
MHTRHILILYATSYGQTAKIATRIRDVLARHGYDVTMINANELRGDIALDAFDGVVIGASVIIRGHQPSIRRFMEQHREALSCMPSAFFSVSASAGSLLPASRTAAERLREDFLKRMVWFPRLSASIAGAVNYTRYNPLLRWYMKQASRANGGSTDTSRDHEYTNWAQVEQFAEDFAYVVEMDACRRDPPVMELAKA